MAQSELSPSKKRRLHPQPASNMNDEEYEEMAARLLYFDILPENAISNVVRFLSEAPRAETWADYIDLVDISGLYDVKGELGAFMLTLCTALRLDNSHASYSVKLDSEPEAIGCESRYFLDISLPERVAESFSVLVVRKGVEKHVDFNSFQFPNIRELILDIDIDAKLVWLLILGPKIESLHCGNFSYDIARYCPHLRHLYIFGMYEYRCDVMSWKKIGEKLETLSVDDHTDTTNEIEFVEKYCRKIKQLKLSGNSHAVREAISKCIASFGNQLERVRLDSLTENQLLRVKSACPKAKIELFTKKVHLAQTLKIVGSELDEVTLDSDDDSQEMEEELVDWSACTNIKKSEFRCPVTVADIQRFMKSPKYHLRSIDISIHGKLKKVKSAISLIAKGTGGLEEFDFTCDDAALGTFKELVDANRSMRNVRICLVNSAQEKEVATDIVKTFLKSPSLKNLEVSSFRPQFGVLEIAEIERICRTQGWRRVCISVLGRCYLR